MLTNSPGYDFYKALKEYNKEVDVYDPIVQENNQDKTINFLAEHNFNLHTLRQEYDLIVVNTKPEYKEEYVLSCYKKFGGKLHIF